MSATPVNNGGETMPPGSGQYGMKFVLTGKYAALRDTDPGSPIVQASDSSSDHAKWNLKRLKNSNKYTIQSSACSHYTQVEDVSAADIGHDVLSKPDSFQWTLKKTSTDSNRFYIYLDPANSPLGWNIADDQEGTHVTLANSIEVSAEWIFEKR
ncbi:hypothetical protein SERLA73DRAFT_177682 [Serpula lacrymans var. lacrymans S7.3]|uniref:Ricin B lectin domain-containing protein n=2 Tax=Serpula lacrymans var. lacrymans TaxID=341189 RepID=F8PPB8_SERL3|nr:uncharacterized protein SERLADRAFT_461410 [Serpula lacrymans var. lacrymans S7.9]EGO01995.1 hypothetical protein SERLA73DRAFT_177682 [Serpula lacrymans var. lacrymans S7.3]EGO27620.1 hypothetical protein SERLADRAFT_461410 [Serpula lacrymans var. lacrymans S7.9]